MRYYDLRITDPGSGKVWSIAQNGGFARGNAPTTFTSHPQGPTGWQDPGALNIEMDIPVAPFHEPQGNGQIRVWGVGLQSLGQAANLNGANFTLRAGMGKGLPLAKPQQAGIILQGEIFQAFGNWQGVNQTLDMICYSSAATVNKDIMFFWEQDMSLGDAIVAALSGAGAYPAPAYKIAPPKIASNLVSGITQAGHYPTLQSFAQYINDTTKVMGQSTYGKDYAGVQIIAIGNTFYIFDGTIQQQTPTQLAFEDLIGQPTWMGPGTINFKTVLRADLAMGNAVKFPAGITAPFALTAAAAAAPGSPARDSSVFQGQFTIINVHHYANFRQPDGDSWNTTFEAVPLPNFTVSSKG